MSDSTDSTEQVKFDAEVASDTAVLDALEHHASELESVIVGLKSQPAAQAMNFSALDVFSMRLKADSLGVLDKPVSTDPLPVLPPAVPESRPGDLGVSPTPATPNPAPTNVAEVTPPVSTLPTPGVVDITDQPASTMIPPVTPVVSDVPKP